MGFYLPKIQALKLDFEDNKKTYDDEIISIKSRLTAIDFEKEMKVINLEMDKVRADTSKAI